jgi:alpha-glucoside transport system permease protein
VSAPAEAVSAAAARPRPAAGSVRRAFSSPLASGLVVLLTVLWTIPTFGLLAASFRPSGASATSGWWTVFTHPHLTFSNYNTVLFQSASFGGTTGIFPYLINSLAITIPATLFPLAIAAMAAYVLAWVKFKGSDALFFFIFALQVVPLQMALIPLLSLFSTGAHIGNTAILPALNVQGTYVSLWAAHTMFALPLAIYLLHNFIAQIPRDLVEAGLVDGASHFRVFRAIILPLTTPALAAFGIFQFLWVWNDLLVGLTFAGGTPDVEPLTVRLSQMTGSFGGRWELLTAGAFIAMVVPLAVFFSLQRYFVRGLLAGSVKG